MKRTAESSPAVSGFLRARRYAGMLVLVGLIAAVAAMFLTRPRQEIVYEGRSLDNWLNSGFEDASRAMHDIGPAAVPAIFAKLRREHPRLGYWQRYRVVWQKLPLFLRGPLPKPRTVCFDEWRACQVLTAIGPRAIPPLVTSLRDRNPVVRATSAQALAWFGERGVDLRKALPALRDAAQDPNPEVRRQASRALVYSHPV